MKRTGISVKREKFVWRNPYSGEYATATKALVFQIFTLSQYLQNRDIQKLLNILDQLQCPNNERVVVLEILGHHDSLAYIEDILRSNNNQ